MGEAPIGCVTLQVGVKLTGAWIGPWRPRLLCEICKAHLTKETATSSLRGSSRSSMTRLQIKPTSIRAGVTC